MTQKDKEILFKDLCGRLPYGVIVDYKENEFEVPRWKITNIHPDTFSGWIGYDKKVGAGSESGSRPFKIETIKPYLRSMSKMTGEEKVKLAEILDKSDTYLDDGINDNGFIIGTAQMGCSMIDWLLEHHFDCRDLISKGLALEAPEGMYTNPSESTIASDK